jgi:hypothetical protein
MTLPNRLQDHQHPQTITINSPPEDSQFLAIEIIAAWWFGTFFYFSIYWEFHHH